MSRQRPAATTGAEVDVLATLVALQEQIEQLTAAVAAHQRTLDTLTRARHMRADDGRGE